VIRIDKVSLHNFMSVSKADLDFSDAPIVMFWGRSGQGKSAVFDAVVLCWTGKKRSGAYLEYVKQGKPSATVDMEATIRGEPIKFHVELHHKGHTPFTREVTYAGVTYTNNEATDFIASLDVLYYFEVLAMLQGAEDVVSLSPARRSEYMQRLFNFSFDDQISTIKLELEALSKDKTAWTNEKSTNEALIEASKDRIERLPKELSESEIEAMESTISDLEEKINATRTEREKRDSLRLELLDLTKQEMSLRKDRADVLKEIERLERELQQELDKGDSKKEAEQKLIRLFLRIDEASIVKKTLQTSKDHYQESLKEVDKKYSDTRKELDEIDRLFRSIDEKICPHCGQPSERHAKKLMFEKYGSTDWTMVRSKFMNNASELTIADEELKFQLHEIEVKLAQAESIIATSGFEAETIKASIVEVDEVSVKTLESAVSAKRKVAEDLAEKIADVADSVLKKNQEVDTIVIDDVAVQKTKLAETKEKLMLAKSTKERNKKTKEEESKTQAQLKIENEELITKIEEATVASNVREEAIDIVTKHFVNWLVVKTCDNLQQTMNEVIHEIFPNYHVKLEQSTYGVKFLYTKDEALEKNSHNRWLDGRMSSGFERALLSAAFRISLCILYEIPLLILDEIDSVADDESSKQLYEHIFSLGNFSQIILVSHKPEIRFLLTDTVEEAMVYHVEGGNFELEE